MINLTFLCCPETRQSLEWADSALLKKLNEGIAHGSLNNRGGKTVREQIESGLVRQDRKFLYPVRGGIPVMLTHEAIPTHE